MRDCSKTPPSCKSGQDQKTSQTRFEMRLLKFLKNHGAANLVFSANLENQARAAQQAHLVVGERKFAIDLQRMSHLLSSGLVERQGLTIRLTEPGKKRLIRLLHPEDGFREQHAQTRAVCTSDKTNTRQSTVESPLDRLKMLKSRDGTKFLEPELIEAGERLRRDFEKAQLQPNMTSNWQAIGSASGRANAQADFEDHVLDARKRFSGAVEHIGPELGDAAVDVCCFLKGMELVERERGWPVRSAKIMIKTALAALARHYGFVSAPPRTHADIQHWGDGSHVPSL